MTPPVRIREHEQVSHREVHGPGLHLVREALEVLDREHGDLDVDRRRELRPDPARGFRRRACARELLALAPVVAIDAIKAAGPNADEPSTKAHEQQASLSKHPCPCCGGRMIIIETFARGQQPQNYPTPGAPKISIDTS